MQPPKQPGVYIKERDAYPNSVVAVETSVPVFLGYTETAQRAGEDVTAKPVRLTSLAEYQQIFGGPCTALFARHEEGRITASAPRRYLHPALQMFVANGGGPFWVVSLGGYDTPPKASDVTDTIWEHLRALTEPALILAPDAAAMPPGDHAALNTRMLAECAATQSRFAILDLPTADAETQPDAIKSFRSAIAPAKGRSYGAAYAPWLNTTITLPQDINMRRLDPASRKTLAAAIQSGPHSGDRQALTDSLTVLTSDAPDPMAALRAHLYLQDVSPVYAGAMQALNTTLNRLPPSGAIAGIYAQCDTTVGVWKAPANWSLALAASVTADISDAMQADMNAPADGVAINAIRPFPGQGVLVWGARTLKANSPDWRYVPLRRTMLIIEQSSRIAPPPFLFHQNNAATLRDARNTLENILTPPW